MKTAGCLAMNVSNSLLSPGLCDSFKDIPNGVLSIIIFQARFGSTGVFSSFGVEFVWPLVSSLP